MHDKVDYTDGLNLNSGCTLIWSLVNPWVTNDRIHGNATLDAFQVRDVKLGSKGRAKGGQQMAPKISGPNS